MWCKHCRQDVPGLATSAPGRLACARCGVALVGTAGPAHIAGVEQLAAHGVDLAERPTAPSYSTKPPLASGKAPSATTNVPSAPSKVPSALDEWDFDHDLRQLQGLVAAAKAGRTLPAEPVLPGIGHLTLAPQAVQAPVAQREPKPKRRKLRSSLLAWSVLSLGLTAFVCGGVLLGMSFAMARTELWTLGMPILVAGQVGLLLGLVLQLERVWQGSRSAVEMLDDVDQQLHELKQSTNMLGVTHGSAAQAFYAHMAEGASPHLLLADLKGQLDLLAVRMSQR